MYSVRFLKCSWYLIKNILDVREVASNSVCLAWAFLIHWLLYVLFIKKNQYARDYTTQGKG